ncbi:MAG TPA: hypothetical protein VFA59_11260 [Vicinamibacterales bacterium]|nr:hypothetical protein [Vicinamibacterales bacterium]
MVHYDAAASVAPKPMALCPKCGSHRTEVVGKSLDDAVVVIRCNACGERSEIANPALDHASANAAGVASLMKAFVIGGDFRRRVRTRSVQA